MREWANETIESITLWPTLNRDGPDDQLVLDHEDMAILL
jgi:hypothetical protein